MPIQASEQYISAVLFVMQYEAVLTFGPVNESQSMTIQMKAIEQYVSEVLFIMLFKVVLTVESVNEIMLTNDHSNAVLCYGTLLYLLWCSLFSVIYKMYSGIFFSNVNYGYTCRRMQKRFITCYQQFCFRDGFSKFI